MSVGIGISQLSNEPKRIAILIESEFEDIEFRIVKTALQQTGADVVVVGGRMNERYQGHAHAVTVTPAATATETHAEDFDALILLGGSIRANPNVIRLIRDAIALSKWVVAIGYGPQVLIDTDQLGGKRVTGFRAIRKDLENAGAIYMDAPVVTDAPFITARRPGDVPIVMTTLMRLLELSVADRPLPQTNNLGHDWWQLGEQWGGTSRLELVRSLNTAIVGEHYTLQTFKQYHQRAIASNLRILLAEIIESKQKHIKQLETRLHKAFGEEVTWQAIGSEAYATLQSWLQANDDRAIIRRTLGDLQTGIVDAYRLCNQLTDPTTAEILDTVASELSGYEQCLAALYRKSFLDSVQPPLPTTVGLVQ